MAGSGDEEKATKAQDTGGATEMPDVRSTIRDENRNVTYHVLAYRALARDELVAAVRHYHSQPSVRRKGRQMRNAVITIFTTHGATGGL